jgi:hypothetical protein
MKKSIFAVPALCGALLCMAATTSGLSGDGFSSVALTQNPDACGSGPNCLKYSFLGCAGADPDEHGPWPEFCKATQCWVVRDGGCTSFNSTGWAVPCTSPQTSEDHGRETP